MNPLGENDLNKLYEDAIYNHLLGKGYSEYQAKVMAKRWLAKQNEL